MFFDDILIFFIHSFIHWSSESHLSSGARENSRILGGTGGPTLPGWGTLLEAEQLLAVPGEISEGHPCAPVILGALQQHGSGAGGAENQYEMRKEKLGLQVQLDGLLLHSCGRLPPGVGVSERAVAHRRGRVSLTGGDGAAPAALRGRAGLPPAGGSGLLEGAEGLRRVEAAD